MENSQQLAHQPHGLSVASGTFLTASQQTIAVEMHLSALNSKSEPESELTAEFSRRFAGERPDVIQWAFRQWRETSEFFPAISEIVTLVRRRKIEIIERLETKRQREEAIEREEARAANRASALPKIQSRRMPEADPDARAKLKRQAAEVADRKGKQ